MNDTIKADLYRYIGDDVNKMSRRLKLVLFSPAVTFIYFFRKAQGGVFLSLMEVSASLMDVAHGYSDTSCNEYR